MKQTKIILIALLLLHLACLLIANITGLNYEDSADYNNKINSFGKIISHIAKKITISNKAHDLLYYYAVYSGTNRGYEFFSPNISNVWTDLNYVTDNRTINSTFLSREGKNKFFTANFYLNKYFLKPKLRDEILKSISLRLFSLNPTIKKINITISFHKIKRLKAYQEHVITDTTFTGFTITRYD